jgi:hypothetical protein
VISTFCWSGIQHLITVTSSWWKTDLKPSVSLPHTNFRTITHLSWVDLRHDFGQNEWIFSRQNAGIRSYGFWKAYQAGADIVITIDDDCYPVGDPNQYVAGHIDNVSLKSPRKWIASYPDPKWMYTRGFPYQIREEFPVMVSHGLWSGALDLDGQTESKLPSLLSRKSVSVYPAIYSPWLLLPDV